MDGSSFRAWWVAFMIILLGMAWWIGSSAKKSITVNGKDIPLSNGFLRILIDTRGRFSLTHFQVVLWTIVILSTLIAVLISNHFDFESVKLTPELLGLMGISAGSAVVATGVKANKDAPGSGVTIAKAGTPRLKWNEVEQRMKEDTADPIEPHFAQIFLEEEGSMAEQVVSITKFQNFIFTLVILGVYVVGAWNKNGFPELSEKIVWLIGISHAGYVGGKVPNKK